jgi:hypothetical protein
MTNLYNWHSKERIDDYKKYVKDANYEEQIKQLYWLNQRLSVFLYHVIANCELALRNKINNYLIKLHGDGWYNDLDCIEADIRKAKEKLKRDKKKESNGKILSELSFGTWTQIIKHYKKETDYDFFIEIFSLPINNPNVKIINMNYKMCEQIRKLRNRCVHHENIIKDLNKLTDVYADLLGITSAVYDKKYIDIIFQEINKHYNLNYSNTKTVFKGFIKDIKGLHK